MDRGACLYEGVEAAKVLDKWALSVAIGGKTGIIFRIGLAGVPPEWRTGHETIWTDFADCAGSAGCARRCGRGGCASAGYEGEGAARDALARDFGARNVACRYARTFDGKRRLELGSYTLEDLGLVESAHSYITVGLTQLDLLPQEEFEALGLRERISWSLGGRGSAQNVTLDAASLDTAKPEADANRVERTAPQDAKVSFEDGKFTLQAETGGNTLRDGAVHDAIAQALTAWWIWGRSRRPSRQS